MDSQVKNYREAARRWMPERLEGHRSANALIEEISTYAVSANASDDEFYDLAERGFSVLTEIANATNEDWDAEKHNEWRHKRIPIVGKKFGAPYVSIIEIENAAATYLELPYRVVAIDRILVDTLIASELAAYLDTPQSKTPSFGKALLWHLGILALVYWIADGEPWGWIVMALLAAWFCITSIYVGKRNKKIKALKMSMNDTYLAMAGQPSSIKRVSKLVDAAAEIGAVWPAPLFVLLEDIAKRRTSF